MGDQMIGTDSASVAPVAHVAAISPRPVFLIYGDADRLILPDDSRLLFARAGAPKQAWKIAGAGHVGGYGMAGAEYERRVAGFFHRALVSPPHPERTRAALPRRILGCEHRNNPSSPDEMTSPLPGKTLTQTTFPTTTLPRRPHRHLLRAGCWADSLRLSPFCCCRSGPEPACRPCGRVVIGDRPGPAVLADPQALLKDTMTRYAAMETFQADYAWRLGANGEKSEKSDNGAVSHDHDGDGDSDHASEPGRNTRPATGTITPDRRALKRRARAPSARCCTHGQTGSA
jgi:hypothetical protein